MRRLRQRTEVEVGFKDLDGVMEKTTNCPNCGAPIDGDKCPYCGTEVIDLCCLDTDKPFFIKIRHNGQILRFRVITRSINIESQYDYLECGCLSDLIPNILPSVSTDIEINLSAVNLC